jgi:hypothetical protein
MANNGDRRQNQKALHGRRSRAAAQFGMAQATMAQATMAQGTMAQGTMAQGTMAQGYRQAAPYR